jgi:hypothetical protein
MGLNKLRTWGTRAVTSILIPRSKLDAQGQRGQTPAVKDLMVWKPSFS